MAGTIKLPLVFGKFFVVAGGPYRQVPDNMVGVKMAVEISHPHQISIPTRDFDVPRVEDVDKGLVEAVNAILNGDPVYVGCMGGIGRTGLFLAILAKAFGVLDPVPYTRDQYNHHAVETKQQMQYVQDYPIPLDVQFSIGLAKFFKVWTFRSNLTNPVKK